MYWRDPHYTHHFQTLLHSFYLFSSAKTGGCIEGILTTPSISRHCCIHSISYRALNLEEVLKRSPLRPAFPHKGWTLKSAAWHDPLELSSNVFNHPRTSDIVVCLVQYTTYSFHEPISNFQRSLIWLLLSSSLISNFLLITHLRCPCV